MSDKICIYIEENLVAVTFHYHLEVPMDAKLNGSWTKEQ